MPKTENLNMLALHEVVEMMCLLPSLFLGKELYKGRKHQNQTGAKNGPMVLDHKISLQSFLFVSGCQRTCICFTLSSQIQQVTNW